MGGGLTFAESDYHCDKGGPDDAWWIGFDCGHAFDAPDPELLPDDERSRTWIESFRGMDRGIAGYPRTTIKTTRYVQTECESLCEQAAKAATGKVS